MRKPGLCFAILFISVICRAQNEKAVPADILKAKENPVWSFHDSFLDSCQLGDVIGLHKYDTLLIFNAYWLTFDNGTPAKNAPKPYSRTIPFSETGTYYQNTYTKFYVVSANTGKLIWSKEEYFSDIGEDYVDKGVLIHQDGRTITRFDIRTGKPLWKVAPQDTLFTDPLRKESCYSDYEYSLLGDTLYAMQHHNCGSVDYLYRDLYLINVNTGKIIRHFPLPGGFTDCSNNIIINDEYALTAINAFTGKKLWSLSSSSEGPLPYANGEFDWFSIAPDKLLVESFRKQNSDHHDSVDILLTDLSTGKVLNKTGLPFNGLFKDDCSMKRIDSSHILFITKTITCFNPVTFQKKWNIPLPNPNMIEPYTIGLAEDGDILYILDDETELEAINKENGKIVFAKKYAGFTSLPLGNITVLGSFIVITQESSINKPSTIITNKNNPEDYTVDENAFKILNYDSKNNFAYIFNLQTKSLLKIKTPK